MNPLTTLSLLVGLAASLFLFLAALRLWFVKKATLAQKLALTIPSGCGALLLVPTCVWLLVDPMGFVMWLQGNGGEWWLVSAGAALLAIGGVCVTGTEPLIAGIRLVEGTMGKRPDWLPDNKHDPGTIRLCGILSWVLGFAVLGCTGILFAP